MKNSQFKIGDYVSLHYEDCIYQCRIVSVSIRQKVILYRIKQAMGSYYEPRYIPEHLLTKSSEKAFKEQMKKGYLDQITSLTKETDALKEKVSTLEKEGL